MTELADSKPGYVVRLNLLRSQLAEESLVLRPQDRSVAPVDIQPPQNYTYAQEWLDHLGQTVAPLIPAQFA